MRICSTFNGITFWSVSICKCDIIDTKLWPQNFLMTLLQTWQMWMMTVIGNSSPQNHMGNCSVCCYVKQGNFSVNGISRCVQTIEAVQKLPQYSVSIMLFTKVTLLTDTTTCVPFSHTAVNDLCSLMQFSRHAQMRESVKWHVYTRFPRSLLPPRMFRTV
jgi:hypothetical protein